MPEAPLNTRLPISLFRKSLKKVFEQSNSSLRLSSASFLLVSELSPISRRLVQSFKKNFVSLGKIRYVSTLRPYSLPTKSLMDRKSSFLLMSEKTSYIRNNSSETCYHKFALQIHTQKKRGLGFRIQVQVKSLIHRFKTLKFCFQGVNINLRFAFKKSQNPCRKIQILIPFSKLMTRLSRKKSCLQF